MATKADSIPLRTVEHENQILEKESNSATEDYPDIERESSEEETKAILPKIPGSIKFSDVLRGKRFSEVVFDLDHDLGYLHKHYYPQDKDILYEFLHRKFEYWMKHFSHDVAFLWLMEGYYIIYNFTQCLKVKFYLKRFRQQLQEYEICDVDHIMSRIAKMLCLIYLFTNKPGKAWKWLQVAKQSLQHKESCEITGFILQCESWVFVFLAKIYPKQRQLYKEKAFRSMELSREHVVDYCENTWLQHFSSGRLLDLAMIKLDLPLPFLQDLYPQMLEQSFCKCNIGYSAVSEAETIINAAQMEFDNHFVRISTAPVMILLHEIYLEIRRIQVTNPLLKHGFTIPDLKKVEEVMEKYHRIINDEEQSKSSILMFQGCRRLRLVFPHLKHMYENRTQECHKSYDVNYMGDIDCNNSDTPFGESSFDGTASSEVQ